MEAGVDAKTDAAALDAPEPLPPASFTDFPPAVGMREDLSMEELEDVMADQADEWQPDGSDIDLENDFEDDLEDDLEDQGMEDDYY